MKIQIINGPNLNLLGTREKDIYGDLNFEKYLDKLNKYFSDIEINYYQSNVEGEIITFANVVLAFINMKTMRPTRCPKYILDKLQN